MAVVFKESPGSVGFFPDLLTEVLFVIGVSFTTDPPAEQIAVDVLATRVELELPCTNSGRFSACKYRDKLPLSVLLNQ